MTNYGKPVVGGHPIVVNDTPQYTQITTAANTISVCCGEGVPLVEPSCPTPGGNVSVKRLKLKRPLHFTDDTNGCTLGIGSDASVVENCEDAGIALANTSGDKVRLKRLRTEKKDGQGNGTVLDTSDCTINVRSQLATSASPMPVPTDVAVNNIAALLDPPNPNPGETFKVKNIAGSSGISVTDEGNVIVIRQSSSGGQLPASSTQHDYLYWDTGAASWKVGEADGDSVHIAKNSVATNGGTAVGAYSHAGKLAVAVGPSTASGDESVAIGDASVASASGAVAIGNGCVATGEESVALGTSNRAEGLHTIAVGEDVEMVGGQENIAIGTSLKNNAKSHVTIIGDNLEAHEHNATYMNNFRVPAQKPPGYVTQQQGGDHEVLFVEATPLTRDDLPVPPPCDGAYLRSEGGAWVAGENDVQIGCGSSAAENSVAIGTGASAETQHTTVVGSSAFANKIRSSVFGHNASSRGVNSTALGAQNRSLAENALTVGYDNVIGNNCDHGIAIGTGNHVNINDLDPYNNVTMIGHDLEPSAANSVLMNQFRELTDPIDGYVTQKRNGLGEGEIIYVNETPLVRDAGAGGDLSGTYPNPTVAKIQGIPVSASQPFSGSVLMYNGFTSYVAVHATGEVTGPYTNLKISNDAVTTPKLNNLAVTTAKIADNAISSAKLANDAVTTNAISDGNVTQSKLAVDSVGTAQLQVASVTGDKMNFTTPYTGNIRSTTGYEVNGLQVVGMQQPSIADIGTPSGSDLTINAILAVLRAHGLIEPL